MLTILSFLGADYHQYDFFVYPEITKVEKGVFGRVWDVTGGWVTKMLPGNTPTVEAFTPLSTKEMAKKCLSFYLEHYKNILLNGYDENFQVEEFVKGVKLIVNQHQAPVVQHQNFVHSVPLEHIKDVRKFTKTLSFGLELKW